MRIETNILLKVITPLLLQLVGLAASVSIDPYIKKRDKKILLIIVTLSFVLIIQNILPVWLKTRENALLWLKICAACGYIIRPVIIALFMFIVNNNNSNNQLNVRMVTGLVALNTLIYLAAVPTQFVFSYHRDTLNFNRGPLGYTCHVISFILLFWAAYQAIRVYRVYPVKSAFVPILCTVLITLSVIADTTIHEEQTPSYLTITIISCSIFYYIWLHMQFVQEHERALLAEQRIRIMISQIQPHFLFNTLSTIQALCRIDPEKAFVTLEKFGTYLRDNIDSLDQESLVPFLKELEHTKIYSEIENIRFPLIHVEYDIGDDDFNIPSLTLQPIVENAIRHGVRIRKQGLVTVTSRKEDGAHVITIQDNGKGFDPTVAFSDNMPHIGIKNVTERLKAQCDGTLSIESELGIGTTVVIKIPVTSNQ